MKRIKAQADAPHVPAASAAEMTSRDASRTQNNHTSGSRHRRWTSEEDAVLKMHYGRSGALHCAELLGRTKGSVNARAEDLGIRSKLRRPWTHKEEAALRLQYATMTAPRLARLLKRSEVSVRRKLFLMGLTEAESTPWNGDDIAYLRAHYEVLSNAEIASELGRTVDAVGIKAGRLGLRRKQTPLTKSQERYIADNLGRVPNATLARELGVPLSRVQGVAEKHGCRRPAVRAWSTTDDETLRRLFPTLANAKIAERMGRTAIAVANHARALGLFRLPQRRKPKQ